ncbi:30S ribosomal protein S20 [Haliovirga abyssi]|uniref:Small ribosomal subunit protein bS20 n=1 Tax=Haliovirga abyssi TaxID=2996794 RepID=A0AAU9DE50_9FUSO|nr:30S ribosomal protein S20 [Haliovirga abyssi]BDU50468.1 30S ribosomal protein S20 [Haliovirga abyssi]
MAHSVSAKKRIRVAERNRLRNQSVKSRVKTTLKQFETAIENNDIDTAKVNLSAVYKELDKAAQKGILHKNTVARKKSRLTAELNKLV